MMNPGYAKPRSELPWLPYPESDKVFVINAHNFGGGAFSPAVNGKMPIAAWIPSRDDAGNGTTTLTDLVGSNNGTLTNMDPATDWVADTGAGGVRALDFDEINDRVHFADVTLAQWSYSCWFYIRSLNGFPRLWAQTSFRLEIAVDGSSRIAVFDGTWRAFGTAIAQNAWNHLVVTYDGASLRAYVNGTQRGTTLTAGRSMTGLSYVGGISNGQSQDQYDGRIDDIRIFDQALDATDASDLYTVQRGGDAS